MQDRVEADAELRGEHPINRLDETRGEDLCRVDHCGRHRPGVGCLVELGQGSGLVGGGVFGHGGHGSGRVEVGDLRLQSSPETGRLGGGGGARRGSGRADVVG